MAAEMIYCPSCKAKVQVPEELLGQPVQCPLCNLMFTAPTRGAAPPPPTVLPGLPAAPRPAAADLQGEPGEFPPGLRLPAMGLLATGVIGLLVSLYIVTTILKLGPQGMAEFQEEGEKFLAGMGIKVPPRDPQASFQSTLMTYSVLLLINGVIILGATMMLRLRAYPLGIAASILAVIDFPCCCFLGMPFGIWSLIILSHPEIREAFRANVGP